MTTTPPAHPARAAAARWHLAGSLVSLKAAVDAHWPKRDKASDGGIGDEDHQQRGSASDHNPWLNDTVRAYDFDKDGIDAHWLAEQLRLAGAAGDRRLAGGPSLDDNGYVIFARHITAPDFSRWVPYEGPNPHDAMVHVSVTRDPAGYEDASPWPFLAQLPAMPGVTPVTGTAPAPAAAPVPAGYGAHDGNQARLAPYPDQDPVRVEPGYPPPGHDAAGAGRSFRAQHGNVGHLVEALQRGLNTYAPVYSQLVEDGIYGDETAAVVEEYAHRIAEDPATPDADRQGLREADGNNVGPRLAAALDRSGIYLS